MTYGEPRKLTVGQLRQGVQLYLGGDPRFIDAISQWKFFSFRDAWYSGDKVASPMHEGPFRVSGVSFLVRRLYHEAEGTFVVLFDNGELHEKMESNADEIRMQAEYPDANQSAGVYNIGSGGELYIHTPLPFLNELTTKPTVYQTGSFSAPGSVFIVEHSKICNVLGPDSSIGAGYGLETEVLEITPLYSFEPFGKHLIPNAQDRPLANTSLGAASRAVELANAIRDENYTLESREIQLTTHGSVGGSEEIVQFLSIAIRVEEVLHILPADDWPSQDSFPTRVQAQAFSDAHTGNTYFILGIPILVRGDGELSEILQNTQEVFDVLTPEEGQVRKGANFWGWILQGAKAVLSSVVSTAVPGLGGLLVDAAFRAISFVTAYPLSKSSSTYETTSNGTVVTRTWNDLATRVVLQYLEYYALSASLAPNVLTAIDELRELLVASESSAAALGLQYGVDLRFSRFLQESEMTDFGSVLLPNPVYNVFINADYERLPLMSTVEVIRSTVDPDYACLVPMSTASMSKVPTSKMSAAVGLKRPVVNNDPNVKIYQIPVWAVIRDDTRTTAPDTVAGGSAVTFFLDKGVLPYGGYDTCPAVSMLAYPLYDINGDDTGGTVAVYGDGQPPTFKFTGGHVLTVERADLTVDPDAYTSASVLDPAEIMQLGADPLVTTESGLQFQKHDICAAFYQAASTYDEDGCIGYPYHNVYLDTLGGSCFVPRVAVVDPLDWSPTFTDPVLFFRGSLAAMHCGFEYLDGETTILSKIGQLDKHAMRRPKPLRLSRFASKPKSNDVSMAQRAYIDRALRASKPRPPPAASSSSMHIQVSKPSARVPNNRQIQNNKPKVQKTKQKSSGKQKHKPSPAQPRTHKNLGKNKSKKQVKSRHTQPQKSVPKGKGRLRK
jgi:hypothetical protein